MKRLLLLFAGCLAWAASSPISVEEKGTGDPIIFLPGMGCRGEVWSALTEHLHGHHIVTISIAGFGGVAGSQTDFGEVREAVIQFVRDKHWRKVVLVGHSFGGSLAISIAAASSDLFTKIIILDSYPFPGAVMKAGMTPEEARRMAAAVRQMMIGLDDEKYRAQQTQALRMMISGEKERETVLAWMLASDRATIAAAQFEGLAADLRPVMPKLRQPVLVLGSWLGREALGLSHESVEAALKEQYSASACARIVVSDSARHFLMLDDPQWVAAQIVSFLHE